MKRKKKEKVYLLNGCYHTAISVTPDTWERKNAAIKDDWMVWYRYYDPEHHDKYPNGKFIPVRGMNDHKDLSKRQEATRRIIKVQEQLLQVHNYNAITGAINSASVPEGVSTSNILSKKASFEEALQFALAKTDISKGYRLDIKNHLTHILEAAKTLLYSPEDDDIRSISEEGRNKGFLSGFTLDKLQFTAFKRYHVQTLLTRLGESKKIKWTNNNHNSYKKSLSSLFKYLVDKGHIDENPVVKIPKLLHKSAIREVLADEKAQLVLTHLRTRYYNFFRFSMIFWKSGTRETEFMRLKKSDVDLSKKGFWATILKTRSKSEKREWKEIDSSVMHLWQELIGLISDEDGDYFMFSKNLIPGKIKISEVQITRRWNRLVKNSKALHELGIYVAEDFYAWKHGNTTQVIDKVALELVNAAIEKAQETAAKINSHVSTKMVKTVYDVRQKQRRAELLNLARAGLQSIKQRKKLIIRF